MLLTREERLQRFTAFRSIGVRVHRDSRGDRQVARALAAEYLEDAGYRSVWVIIGVRIIMMLITWWIENQIAVPDGAPLAGEPTADDVDWSDAA